MSFIRLSSAADLTGIGQERKMCRRLPGNAGRKKAGRTRPAKFTGNKPHAREKRRPPCTLGFLCLSQAAVAAGSVGSMNIKSSVHAAVQKLAVAVAPVLGQGQQRLAAPAKKMAGLAGPAECWEPSRRHDCLKPPSCRSAALSS
ncbi:MAG: hypothetical protein WAS21_08380 [Geminicoccaceae bacterium]